MRLRTWKAICIALIVTTQLVGCGTTKEVRVERPYSVNDLPKSDFALYAKLLKSDQGYEFVGVSDAPGGKYDPWVQLNTMKPYFYTGVEGECFMGDLLPMAAISLVTGYKRKSESDCKTLNDDLFRSESSSVGQKIAKGYMTVLTVGLASTARLTNIVFDEDKYNLALSEALKKIDLPGLFLAYEKANRDVAKISSDYEALRKKVGVDLNIDDRTGFYKGGFSSEQFLYISANKLPKASELFKFVPKDEPASPESIARAFELLKPAFDPLVSRFSVSCRFGSPLNFSGRVSCPSEVNFQGGVGSALPVKVSLDSKKFFDVVPKNFQMTDENVGVNVSNGYITLTNKTNRYLSIKNLSVYYAGKIFSEAQVDGEFPPGSEKTVSVKPFLKGLPDTSRTYDRVEAFNSAKVNFGMAVKYAIVDISQEKTMYSNKDYKVADLVSDQL